MVMWCDVNRSVINKDVTNWFDFNNSFTTERLTIEELIGEISNGYSITTVHHKNTTTTKTARHVDNFSFAQHFALDFDGGDGLFEPTLEAVSEIPIVNKYASFLHTTASHTDGKPRARAVFVLEAPLGDRNIYSNAVGYANRIVGVTDTSCVDPVRLFFGAKDCDIVRLDNVVPLSVMKTWAADEEIHKAPPVYELPEYDQIIDASEYRSYVEAAIVSEVSNLSNAYQGNRHMHLLQSASKLGGIMKSPWCPGGLLTRESIIGMLVAACVDNGLAREDGNRSLIATVNDGIDNAIPRGLPATKEMKSISSSHSMLPSKVGIDTVSEISRAYSAYMAGVSAANKWSDISDRTVRELGILFTNDATVIPFINKGVMDDIATKAGASYEYRVGVDTMSSPNQPYSKGNIAIVTKNPEDLAALFDKIRDSETVYKVIGSSEIGKGTAQKLSTEFDEVVFLTYGDDKNIDIAKGAIKNSGILTLQGTIREMMSWGLNEKTLKNMLQQAW